MRVVVDSNRLQSEVLRGYLMKSRSNFAVLTDYAAMEAYKGDTLASIYKSMAILSEFPGQVIVLKGTRAACGLRGRTAGLQRRLIDEAQSSGFAMYANHLRQAQAGNRHLQQQLLDHGKEATAHLDRMLADAQTTGAVIDNIATLYSKAERHSIRLGENYSPALVDKTIKNILHIAATVFHEHPDVRVTPTYVELPNTYIFRVALCTYLLALEWGARGGARHAAPARLRNDFVDMSFAAYATYFDGLMTGDAKVLRIHQEARVWLMALFGCELPSGLGCSPN
ncbi:MAG: hypothetical protein KJ958_02255 [Gammaproteobacteria bacterium]|nr:hypothetical protein [Gammaproteobacteria bacterium]MBU1977972.1 hypothetical protein [Gammaproteobacteria bacterium]